MNKLLFITLSLLFCNNIQSQSFTATVQEIPSDVLERMPCTWRSDCPVALEDLRHVTLLHYDFEGEIQQGELIAHKTVVEDLVVIFEQLFEVKFPTTSIRFVDEFAGSDLKSMQANNTSMFYARNVAGATRWSNHSFGCAIDINPLLNPYSREEYFTPREGQAFLDRSLNLPGMITPDSYIYELFTQRGWQWGGECFYQRDKTIDRHHFQKIIPGLNQNTN